MCSTDHEMNQSYAIVWTSKPFAKQRILLRVDFTFQKSPRTDTKRQIPLKRSQNNTVGSRSTKQTTNKFSPTTLETNTQTLIFEFFFSCPISTHHNP